MPRPRETERYASIHREYTALKEDGKTNNEAYDILATKHNLSAGSIKSIVFTHSKRIKEQET